MHTLYQPYCLSNRCMDLFWQLTLTQPLTLWVLYLACIPFFSDPFFLPLLLQPSYWLITSVLKPSDVENSIMRRFCQCLLLRSEIQMSSNSSAPVERRNKLFSDISCITNYSINKYKLLLSITLDPKWMKCKMKKIKMWISKTNSHPAATDQSRTCSFYRYIGVIFFYYLGKSAIASQMLINRSHIYRVLCCSPH